MARPFLMLDVLGIIGVSLYRFLVLYLIRRSIGYVFIIF